MKIYHYHLLCYSIQMRILFFYIHKDSIGALSGHLQLLDIFSEIWKLIIIIIYFAIQTFIPTLLFILITFRSIYTSVFFSWLLYSCLDSFFCGGGTIIIIKSFAFGNHHVHHTCYIHNVSAAKSDTRPKVWGIRWWSNSLFSLIQLTNHHTTLKCPMT